MNYNLRHGNDAQLQGPRYNFLLEGAMGKPSYELSDPEPWTGSRGTLLEKI